MNRYVRQSYLREVGPAGQEVLKTKSALIVGVGGLGSPASIYLAAAGLGRIGLLDFDSVEESNLNRQILFTSDSQGLPKVDVAKKQLSAFNPDVKFEAVNDKLLAQNAGTIFESYDVIVDGSDNFSTKYLVNDAAVKTGKSFVSASVFQFSGQIGVFNYNNGPCYRCLFPSQPDPGLSLSCAEAGVMGYVPGVIGLMQASEVIKILLNIGEVLSGKLLSIDTLINGFETFSYDKDPRCHACSSPSEVQLLDGPSSPSTSLAQKYLIEPEDLRSIFSKDRSVSLVDVRSPHEHSSSSFPSCTSIPLDNVLNAKSKDEFFAFGDGLQTSDHIILYCQSGVRSQIAVNHLKELGIKSLSLAGGMDRWLQVTND